MLRISYINSEWNISVDGKDITEYVQSFEISGNGRDRHNPTIALHLNKGVAVDIGDVNLEEIDVTGFDQLPGTETILQAVPPPKRVVEGTDISDPDYEPTCEGGC